YSVFMERCNAFTKTSKFYAMITQHSWMFLSGFERMRKKILAESIINMAHLGSRAFEEISGEVVQTTTFVLSNVNSSDYKSTYVRLVSYNKQTEKERQFLLSENRFHVSKQEFYKVPGSPLAYWISEKIFDVFSEYNSISKFGETRQGMATGNNKKFLRNWFEIEYKQISFNNENREEFIKSQKKYIPYIKSAGFYRWYGNYFNVLKYDKENYSLLSKSGNRLPSRQYYFKNNVNWSLISTDKFGARYADFGGAFDIGAHAYFSNENLSYMLAYLNSKVFHKLINILSPTLNYNSGVVSLVPFKEKEKELVISIANENVEIARKDWDSFEKSWDFKVDPLLNEEIQTTVSSTLEKSYDNWKEHVNNNFE